MSELPDVLFVHPSLTFSGETERLRRTVEHLVADGARAGVLAGPGSRADELRDAGADVVASAPATGWRGVFDAARARRLAARGGYELVHVTGAELARLGATLGRPYLLDLYEPVREKLPIDERNLRRVVLPCGTLEEGVVNRGGVPRGRVRTLPHAPVPPPQEELDGAQGGFAAGAEPLVGCAGALTADLGGRVFLEAARTLLTRGLRARFVLLGEGPEEQALRHAARALGIAREVTVAAPAAPSTAELLARLDVYACPRIAGPPDWLACEALALGLPCVLTTVQGAFGLVEDGRDALLVERASSEKLADGLAALLADPYRARALGASARRRRREAAQAAPFEAGVRALYEESLDAEHSW